MRIIITGASGFIGKELVRFLYLEQKHEIIAIERNHCANNSAIYGVTYFNLDLAEVDSKTFTEITGINNADIIIHAAGQAHITQSEKTKDMFFKNNVNTTKNMLNIASSLNVGHFIYLSSVAAISNDISDYYAQSKFQAEELVKSYNTPYTIIRPVVVYGENDTKGNMFKLIKQINRGFFPMVNKGKTIKNILYVRNLSYLVNTVIESNYTNTIITAKDQGVMNFKEICETIKQDSRCFFVNIPAWVLNSLAVIITPLNSSGILEKPNANSFRKLSVDANFDVGKGNEFLFKSLPFNSREGLCNTVKWIKNL